MITTIAIVIISVDVTAAAGAAAVVLGNFNVFSKIIMITIGYVWYLKNKNLNYKKDRNDRWYMKRPKLQSNEMNL